jgi:hypothetical protein
MIIDIEGYTKPIFSKTKLADSETIRKVIITASSGVQVGEVMWCGAEEM